MGQYGACEEPYAQSVPFSACAFNLSTWAQGIGELVTQSTPLVSNALGVVGVVKRAHDEQRLIAGGCAVLKTSNVRKVLRTIRRPSIWE